MARNAVLGGGALGLTAAYRLAQRGESVVLFERESMPGGLAAGFPLGASYLEKFYHHLFRSDTEARDLIEELGLGERLVWPRPKTAILVGGAIHQLDSPLSVLRFPLLPLADRFRLGAATAYLKLEPNYQRLERTTADAWLSRWMGCQAHEMIWKPQLRAKFGDRYRDIVMAWFWARVHMRSTSLGYLRGGFQQLYDRLVEEIRRLGGDVHFGTAVERVEPARQDELDVTVAGRTERFDRVISTLPTRLTLQLTPALGEDYAARFGSVESFGAQCVILTLDRALTEDVYWLSINEPDFPFMALVEHTNYMPPSDYGGRHLLYLGNYLPMGHPLFKLDEDALVAKFLPFLKRINPAFEESWVKEHRLYRAPFAQPIVTLGYADRLPPHETPVPNLYLANMSQVYPQDRGQNYSISMANRLVSRLPTHPSA
ncbi:MAG TPA: NAD(P)/FAD-dependent oxidoreductase [Chloroflexota bacterium]|nr:NAD(P)/FAD-dependent oxidoreductase [Chloroflexota bacterium]